MFACNLISRTHCGRTLDSEPALTVAAHLAYSDKPHGIVQMHQCGECKAKDDAVRAAHNDDGPKIAREALEPTE